MDFKNLSHIELPTVNIAGEPDAPDVHLLAAFRKLLNDPLWNLCTLVLVH